MALQPSASRNADAKAGRLASFEQATPCKLKISSGEQTEPTDQGADSVENDNDDQREIPMAKSTSRPVTGGADR